jgi:RNA 3'-terminal phosphate cyclase (ATP)
MISIDGSFGEGGGQILRSSLTMSLLTQTPFSITNLRAGRVNPGLRPQHLCAIEAAVKISGSQANGAVVNSKTLEFIPGVPQSGNYVFEVSTAGAMSLVLQTVAMPLALLKQPSQLEFRGGTHVAWAPIYEYIRDVWLCLMKTLGFKASLQLKEAGYYPSGRGSFTMTIEPIEKLKGLNVVERPQIKKLHAISVISNLPVHVAEREISILERLVKGLELNCPFTSEVTEYNAIQPGNVLFLQADFGNIFSGFSSLGQKGKPAEKVAREVFHDLKDFLKTEGCVDSYLSDQILLPLSFASQPSSYRVSTITQHLLTNAQILPLFRKVPIEVVGKEGESGIVKIFA